MVKTKIKMPEQKGGVASPDLADVEAHGNPPPMMKGMEEYQEELAGLNRIRQLVGSNSDLTLPQICVIGDQSTGKSALLSALTRDKLQFPTKSDKCTKSAIVVSCIYDSYLPEDKIEIMKEVAMKDGDGHAASKMVPETVEEKDFAKKIEERWDEMLKGKDQDDIVDNQEIHVSLIS